MKKRSYRVINAIGCLCAGAFLAGLTFFGLADISVIYIFSIFFIAFIGVIRIICWIVKK